MGKFFLTLTVFIIITMVSLDAKPPKLPKPKKDGEWVEPAKPVAPKNIFNLLSLFFLVKKSNQKRQGKLFNNLFFPWCS
jgi:hypothetical protein